MKQNRYVILISGMIIQFCAGVLYLWSVFKIPVSGHLHWDIHATSYTSSIMIACFVLGIVLGGRAQDTFGPRKVTAIGSIFFSGGIALTALVPISAPWLLYITYGILGGLGVGCVYTCAISTVQKWFPEKRGFATGMIMGAFGLSLVVFAPLAETMLTHLGVPVTFGVLGGGFLVICLICAIFIVRPAQAAAAQAATDKTQFSPLEMLRTRQFLFIFISMFLLLPTNFILNPQLKDLGISRGLSVNAAVVTVMITGIASAAGRLVLTWISDTIGRKPALYIIGILLLLSTVLILFAEKTLFIVCCAVITFAFGGSAGVYAAVTTDNFGTKHSGMNFGCVMVAFGLCSLLAPIIGNAVASLGSPEYRFVFAAASVVVSLIFLTMIRKPESLQSAK